MLFSSANICVRPIVHKAAESQSKMHYAQVHYLLDPAEFAVADHASPHQTCLQRQHLLQGLLLHCPQPPLDTLRHLDFLVAEWESASCCW